MKPEALSFFLHGTVLQCGLRHGAGGSSGVPGGSTVDAPAAASTAADAPLLPRWHYGGSHVVGVLADGQRRTRGGSISVDGIGAEEADWATPTVSSEAYIALFFGSKVQNQWIMTLCLSAGVISRMTFEKMYEMKLKAYSEQDRDNVFSFFLIVFKISEGV